jgi:MATE family multidrug resistance protein
MNKNILRLAIPNIISGITIPVLGAVDLAMMGRLNNIAFMGAIALGGMIFNFVYWAIGFLRMGTSGFTAQAFGKEDDKEKVAILGRGLLLAIGFSLILLLLQVPILKLALWVINSESVLESLTASYFKIRIWAAPATISFFVFSGWFIGMQDTKTPMWIAIIINLLNMAFNYVFIFLLDMKIEGSALGTVVAQYSGLLLCLLAFKWKYGKLLPLFEWKCLSMWKEMRRFLAINSNIFFRTLLIIIVFTFFTIESAKYGNTTLVMNNILYQFFIFFSYAIDGFAHAAEALSGRFTGSGETDKKRQSIRLVFLWGLGITICTFIIYASLFNPILHIFTQDMNVIFQAQSYYGWVLVLTIVGMPAFLWDGIYAGSLETKAMLYTMLAAVIGFFGLYYSFAFLLANHALWLGLSAFLLLRGILMTIFARKTKIFVQKNIFIKNTIQ